MIIAPVLIWATSLSAEHGFARALFLTPTEIAPAPVMATREQILQHWSETATVVDQDDHVATSAPAEAEPRHASG